MDSRQDPLVGPSILLDPAQAGLRSASERRLELLGLLAGRPRLAVVGSRAAHRRYLACIEPLVRAAGVRGWSLISGGALGVDGQAHRAALEGGLGQLAVLPLGRDRLYPARHRGLFRSILGSGRGGLLLAQPAGAAPSRAMFASRNAIVVGMADALVVVEAGLRSGSRNTGELALSRGLPVAVIAGSPGCGSLIASGARALPEPPRGSRARSPSELGQLVEAFVRWLEGGQVAPDEAHSRWPPELRWLERRLREAGPGGASLDGLGDSDAVALALTEAEILGLACEAAPGRWTAV